MAPGSQLGSYRIDSLIGQGGMAEVYKAWHTNLHRFEALKVLPAEITGDHPFVERFLQEASTAAGLQHPHIAAIHSVSGAGGPEYYFAMELVEGGDLADLLARRGRLPQAEALHILQQVADALDFAHSRRIIHRDVKPANILLQPASGGALNVKMVDFGIARAQEAPGGSRLTRTGMIVGTPEYMSPEQAGSGLPVDHRSDIYSLGVVAYEMLCGQPPFQSAGGATPISVLMAHLQNVPRPPIEVDPTLPPAVSSALLKALAKNPADRFNSCAEFISVLASAVSGSASGTITTNPMKRTTIDPTPLPRPQRSAAPVLAGLAVVAGVGLIWFGIHASQNSPPTPPTPPSQPVNSQVMVPDVSGLKQAQAESLIKDKGFLPAVTLNHSRDTPKGYVISEEPSGSEMADRGSKIMLHISAGPTAIKAPDVVGLSEDQAIARIKAKSLTTDVTHEHSDSISEGDVIRQSPGGGEDAAPSTQVRLVVSSGPSPITTGGSGSTLSDTSTGWTSSRLVTASDLDGKSGWELTVLRNEIYARHGYRFQRSDLQAYFGSKSWYSPTTGSMDEVTSQLSSTERENVETIKNYQEERGLQG